MDKKLTKAFQKKLLNDAFAVAVGKHGNSSVYCNAPYAIFLLQQAEKLNVVIPHAREKLAGVLDTLISEPSVAPVKDIDLLLQQGLTTARKTLQISTWDDLHTRAERSNEQGVMAIAKVLKKHGYDIDERALANGQRVEIKAPTAKKKTSKPKTP